MRATGGAEEVRALADGVHESVGPVSGDDVDPVQLIEESHVIGCRSSPVGRGGVLEEDLEEMLVEDSSEETTVQWG